MNYIIGCADNIKLAQRWQISGSQFNNKVILLEESSNSNVHLLVKRFAMIADYIYTNLDLIDYVLVTDTYDVYFQDDPFKWMKENMTKQQKVVVGSEGLTYSQEVWNKQNLERSFGLETFEHMKNNTIYCAGVIGGRGKEVADLCNRIYKLCVDYGVTHAIPGGGAADQAAMNIILNTPFKDVVKFAQLSDNFVCHCGTTLADGVINYYQPLLSDVPIIKNNKVYTSNNQLYTIVHQYNRVSGLMGS